MKRTLTLTACILALALLFCGCGAPRTDTEPSPLSSASAAPSGLPSASAEPTASQAAATATPAASVEEPSLLGETDGSQYINKALGFSATIPEGWVVATKEDLQQVSGQAGDLVESATDLDPNSSVMLMMCSQVPLGSTEAFNPNVNIAYSNQTDVLQALTSADVLNQLLDQLQSSYTDMYVQIFPGASVSTSGEQSLTINGKEYVLAKVDTTFDGGAMYQEQYFTKAGDGMITVTATYYDSSEKAATDTFVQSIVFE